MDGYKAFEQSDAFFIHSMNLLSHTIDESGDYMSIWITGNTKEYPSLNQDIECDVVIIGAGMSGLCCAYHLRKQELNIVIVEADRIGYGASGRSTGKVTSQHGFNYQHILNYHGKDKTRRYYELNEQAIQGLKRIIEEYDIQCDWQEKKACICSLDKVMLEKEIEAYETCQIPYIQDTQSHRLLFENQASFDPYQFMIQLANQLDIKIYEQSAYQSMNGKEVQVNGQTIQAKHIIFATQVLPFRYPLFYMITQPIQSSLVALSDSDQSDIMMLMQDEIILTKNSFADFMLLGGYEHEVMKDTQLYWDKLDHYITLQYPHHTILTRWLSQDYKCFDCLPIIGKWNDYYVITGFNKWGNTLSYVAGEVISKCISGRKDLDVEMFSSLRLSQFINQDFVLKNMNVVKDYISNRIHADYDYEEIRQGTIMMIQGHAYGFYQDGSILYKVDVQCPHLGCILQFNWLDKSWDCPCHGSRYDFKGNIIKGPSTQSLKCEVIHINQKG